MVKCKPQLKFTFIRMLTTAYRKLDKVYNEMLRWRNTLTIAQQEQNGDHK